LCIIASMGDVSAFVLAGGRSRRMGTDKAFVVLDGRSLMDRALALAQAVDPGARIVGSREKFGRFGDVVEDEFPDHGPLAGIHAALRVSPTDLNLMLAVDMPFVPVQFLQYLVGKARGGTATVTVPRAAGAWQPLCAVYRRHFAAIAQPALQASRNKIDPLFAQCEVEVLDESELNQAGFSTEIFRNLNTPEELDAARPELGMEGA
jgi:molybdenum cofactor guanylyltransferase